MNIVADNFDINRRGVEVLKLQFAYATTVNGIGPLGIECINIKMFRPLPTSSSGVKATRISPCGIFFDTSQRGHDFRHACFIIRALKVLPSVVISV